MLPVPDSLRSVIASHIQQLNSATTDNNTTREEVIAVIGAANYVEGSNPCQNFLRHIIAGGNLNIPDGEVFEIKGFHFSLEGENSRNVTFSEKIKFGRDCTLESGGRMVITNGKLTAVVNGTVEADGPNAEVVAAASGASAQSINGGVSRAVVADAITYASGPGSTAHADAPGTEAYSTVGGTANANARGSASFANSPNSIANANAAGATANGQAQDTIVNANVPDSIANPYVPPEVDRAAIFRRVIYQQGRVDFEDGDFSGIDLSECNLPSVRFENINLSNGDFSGVNFFRAHLYGVNFSGANLTGASFHTAQLRNINFTGANLTGAQFSLANLSDIDFTGANLSGANLVNIMTNHTINLTDATLDGIIFIRENIMSNYFDIHNTHTHFIGFDFSSFIPSTPASRQAPDTIHIFWYDRANVPKENLENWENITTEDNFSAFQSLLVRLSESQLIDKIEAAGVVEVIQTIIRSPSLRELIFEKSQGADSDCHERPLSIFNKVQGYARFGVLQEKGAEIPVLLELAIGIAKQSLLEMATTIVMMHQWKVGRLAGTETGPNTAEALEYEMALNLKLGERLRLPFPLKTVHALGYVDHVVNLTEDDLGIAEAYVNQVMGDPDSKANTLVSQPVWRTYMEGRCAEEVTEVREKFLGQLLAIDPNLNLNSNESNSEMKKVQAAQEQAIVSVLTKATAALFP